MLDKAIADFWLYFATIDPFGTLIMFTGLTAGMGAKSRTKTAFKAVFIATVILLISLALGQIMLEGLNVRLSAFQIAGGVVLFIFGLQMLFKPNEDNHDKQSKSSGARDIAVFPLALPSIASPGAILAVILATENSKNTASMQLASALSMLVVLGMTLLLMLLADPINKLIGRTGEQVLIRISGLILASVACEFCIEAFETLLG